MSQLSKVKHSRQHWKHKAMQRGDHNRYQRKQIARLRAERNQARRALQETRAQLHQLQSQARQLAPRPKVDVVHLALQLFLVARISFRAVARVLTLLAAVLGISKPPCPQTLINWVTRLSLVRIEAARRLPLLLPSPVPFTNGFLWLIDISIGLGTGKILAVLAVDARHHQHHDGAPTLHHVHCIAVAVAASWTGDTIAALLRRLIAILGRPTASLKDAGSELHKAVDVLDTEALASPCLDDISHAAAGMLKRHYQDHPTFQTFLSACARVSGKLKHTILACLTPPKVRTKARFMNVHRLFTWADQVLKLSPQGGAKSDSLLAKLRACLEHLPACKTLIRRFRADACGLLGCQRILKTKGLSHHTRQQCEPLIDAMPSAALRREFRTYLDFELGTAKALGLDHIGLPISTDAIESLFGVAKRHGTSEIQDAARIALRLPALCGIPTRQEAEQVLQVGVAGQQQFTAPLISLTKQRRQVLANPHHLETLIQGQGSCEVELLARPEKRSNCQRIINMSDGYKENSGPLPGPPGEPLLLENAAPLGKRETILISCSQKPVNGR